MRCRILGVISQNGGHTRYFKTPFTSFCNKLQRIQVRKHPFFCLCIFYSEPCCTIMRAVSFKEIQNINIIIKVERSLNKLNNDTIHGSNRSLVFQKINKYSIHFLLLLGYISLKIDILNNNGLFTKYAKTLKKENR